MDTMTFWSFPWPDARTYCLFIGVVFSIYFGKSLVDAIERSTRVARDGTTSLQSIGYVARGYLWNTIVFWIAALGFIAAYKA